MLMFALLHKQQQFLNFPVVPDCFLLPALIRINPPVKAHAQKEIVLINEQERSFSIHSVCDVWVTFSRCLKCARVTSNSYFAKFAASVSRVKYLKSYLRV